MLIFLPVYFFSCKPQQQLPSYLAHVTDTAGQGAIKIPDLRIQKGDRLSIQVISLSTVPEKSDAIYNQPGAVAGTASENAAPGYLVDNQGNIIHHRLGTFHAEGLTKEELAAEIRKRLTVPVELLKDPTVVVRVINFKVTVLGQVGRESVLTIPDERVTVLEAIGLAGGITDFGKKTNLKIVREANGKHEIGTIDLSSPKLFESPYYYLAQNDVLVVEPTNQKYKDEEQAKTMQKISFAFTLVTVAATIANIFIR